MADENKKAVKADTSETAKSPKKDKKPSKFSPKNIGKGIARFFKDLRGETKKIVWPGLKDVVKNTLIVLIICLAVTAMNKAANETTTAITEVVEDTTDEAVEDTTEASEEETTEATTAA